MVITAQPCPPDPKVALQHGALPPAPTGDTALCWNFVDGSETVCDGHLTHQEQVGTGPAPDYIPIMGDVCTPHPHYKRTTTPK